MERVEKARGDFILMLLIFLLIGVGITVLFSASFSFSERTFKDPYYLLKKQLLWIAIGALIGFIVSLTPLRLFVQYIPVILVLSLILAILPFIPGLGKQISGAQRWIYLFGQSYQPSELVKFTTVLYLASFFSKKEERINDAVNTLLPPSIVVVVCFSIVYLQNDYSTAIFILLIGLLMFYIAKVRFVYFALLSAVAVPFSFILLFTREHRVNRLLTFLNPLADPTGSGYQITAARSALAGGGFWGKGLGRGLGKTGSLPAAHSDFIYAVAGEEMGFLGALLILLLFLLFAWRGYLLAFRSKDSFRQYLAYGITSLIFFQALLNMSEVVGIIPVTGVPLPFISAGGSSLLVCMFMCGMLVNISRAEPSERRGAYV